MRAWAARHLGKVLLVVLIFLVVALAVMWREGVKPAPALVPAEAGAPCEKNSAVQTSAPGNLTSSISVDPASAWRPAGGAVRFTMNGVKFTQASQVMVCFRWSQDHRPGRGWAISPSVRLADNHDLSAPVFTAVLPDLKAPPSNLASRLFDPNADGAWTAAALVPLADLRVVVLQPPAPGPAGTPPPKPTDLAVYLDISQTIGVTSLFLASVTTIVAVLLAWAVLYGFGISRKVPGNGSPILQIISTSSGYASLSQLQILLWAFVVGGSAIYVMVLSGNLIEISEGTLVLLGISGVSGLGSKLQSNAASANTGTTEPPGPVIGLHVNQPPGDNDIRVTWNAPIEGGAADSYTASYRKAADPDFEIATAILVRPGFRLTGLEPDVDYVVRVMAENHGGPGAPIDATFRTAPTPTGAMAAVTGLIPCDIARNTSLSFTWDNLKDAATYQIQYRPHDGDAPWRPGQVQTDKQGRRWTKLYGLEANTLYDIRVAAADGKSGNIYVFGNWTTIRVATAGPRVPRWSDLVVQNDGSNEIEVTRVQMLFFTVVVAVFVVMRVLTSDEIPEIPNGFLLLMGISNGVYLSAKFLS